MRLARPAAPRVLLLALLGSLAVACGDAPQRVERRPTAADQGTGGMPPGHPPIDQAPAYFAGRIDLVGEAGAKESGHVFVNLRQDPVAPLPYLSRKYTLGGADTRRTDDGWAIDFQLDPSKPNVTISMAPLPLQLPPTAVVQAVFDDDGFVETREGQIAGTAPARRGGRDHHVVVGGAAPAEVDPHAGHDHPPGEGH